MKYCEKCRVSVRGMQERCPLCQRRLVGDGEMEECYPQIRTIYKQYRMFFKILIFSTITLGITAAAINLILPDTGRWALFVNLGIAGFWISMYLAVRRKNSLPQSIIFQAVFVSVFSVVWDLITHWRGWSISYVIPGVLVVSMISMTVIARVMRVPASEYLICLVLDIIFGFVPIVFYVLDLLIMPIPSVICISCSMVCLAGILIFQGEEIKKELVRRFHL